MWVSNMPNIRQPKSLFDCTLQNVTTNVDLWCFSHPEIRSLIHLPECIAAKIRNVLKREGKFTDQHATFLLTKQTTKLNLTFSGKDTLGIGSKIVQVASRHCPDLVTLLYSGSNHRHTISKLDDPGIFIHFRRLKVLDVSESSANDECLKFLGIYCSKLEALSVSLCPVSDSGIRHLCIEADNFVSAGCKRLVSLFVRQTQVTLSGIQIAIDNLPQLKYLDHQELPDIENQSSSSSAMNSVHLPLTALTSFLCRRDGVVYFKRSLYFTADIQLESQSFEDSLNNHDLSTMVDPMARFGLWDRRNEAAVNAPAPIDQRAFITFAQGVAPFLARFGSTIKTLQIVGLDSVDISLVLQKCPELLYFALDRNGSYIHSRRVTVNSRTTAVSRCETFIYRGLRSSDIDSVSLFEILLSPHLKDIRLSKCQSLVDSIVIDCFRAHRFKNIENLDIRTCHRLSDFVFRSVFLAESNSIRSVRLMSCRLLNSPENENNLKRLVKQQNWNLELLFST